MEEKLSHSEQNPRQLSKEVFRTHRWGEGHEKIQIGNSELRVLRVFVLKTILDDPRVFKFL